MAFPQNFIMELKSRANLVDVVSSVTELKRAGSNLVGRCPFHNERTGSFTVFDSSDPSAAHYYCFGCAIDKGESHCPDCDTVLASDSQYCPNCGKQILQKAVGYQENTPQGGEINET